MRQQKPTLGSLPNWDYPIRKGLVLDLPMLGEGDLNDYSLNGNNGVNNGAEWVAGPYGPALRFVLAAGDYVSTPSINLGIESFTFIFRAKFNGLGDSSQGRMVDFSGGASLFMRSSSGMSFIRNTDGTNGLWRVSSGITFGETTQVAVTWSGITNEVIFYINGEGSIITPTTSPTGNPDSINSSAFIGNNSAGSRGFDGDISYINIYNKALSAQEIKALYDNPWQAWERDNIALWAAAQAAPVTGGVNLLDGLFERKRLIA